LITNLSYNLLFTCLIVTSFQVASCQIVNYETEVTIADDGKKTTKRTVLIQINTKEENWLSHVELNHNPKQEFEFGYAQILDIKGNIVRKLRKKELITRNDLSYQTFYQDDMITEFDLYWNEYPYRVEYSYTIEEEEYLHLAWWTPIYYTNLTTINGSLEVNVPSDYSIQINASEEFIFKESRLEDKKILRWESMKIKSELQDEIYSPPFQFPRVKIVPEEFNYGVAGSFRSWEEYGLWQHNLNSGTDNLPINEKTKIDILKKDAKSDEEIIRRIYHYMQDHTKYINVAIDVGGLKSYPASYVCENKYGDCKALTTYMKAMVKHAGFNANYTKIYSGINPVPVNSDFPSPQSNHVILAVPMKNDTIWLENTASHLPFNYLGTFTQNRYALAINGKNSQLVKTPKLSNKDVLFERNYNFQLADDYDVDIDLDLTLRGKEFEDYRYFISENDEYRQHNEITRHNGIKDFKINDWNIIDFHRDSTFLQLHIKGTSSSIIRQVGSFQVINPLRIPLPNFEEPNQRKTDVNVNFPINRFDKSIYDLRNLEKTEIQVPDSINIENNFGCYQAKSLIDENKLVVTENFILFANEIPVEKYKTFYEFIDSINNYKKRAAILIK